MDWIDYVKFVDIMGRRFGDDVWLRRTSFALGLVGELGEVAEWIKKNEIHKKQNMNREDLKLEVGDYMFYCVAMWALNVTQDEVAEGIVRHMTLCDPSHYKRFAGAETDSWWFLQFINAKKECGDEYTDCIGLCYSLGFDPVEVARANMDKLNKRYSQ